VNTLSEERDILKLSPIDARSTIYRLDLEAYNMELEGPLDNRDDFTAVTDVDPFKFESFTSKGLQIKALTGVAIPWLHGDNYAF
jgi:hypothetical protein